MQFFRHLASHICHLTSAVLAVSSRGPGHSPLKAGTRVRIPLPLLQVLNNGTGPALREGVVFSRRDYRPHRLSVRTALFQGAERGSTPLGAVQRLSICVRQVNTGAVAQLVRVPVCHTGGRGFDPRQPRTISDFRLMIDDCRSEIRNQKSEIIFALVVKLVDTPS